MTRAGNCRGLLRWYILLGLCQNKDFNLLFLILEGSSKHTSNSLHCGSKRDASWTHAHLWFLLILELCRNSEKKTQSLYHNLEAAVYVIFLHAVCLVYQDAFCKDKKPFPFNTSLLNREVCIHIYIHIYIHTRTWLWQPDQREKAR